MIGILEQARLEGYRNGVGQASMVNYDDAYERGRQDQESDTSRACLKWWLIGVFGGVWVTWTIGWLL